MFTEEAGAMIWVQVFQLRNVVVVLLMVMIILWGSELYFGGNSEKNCALVLFHRNGINVKKLRLNVNCWGRKT